MSSESQDQNLLAQSEPNTQELSKQSRITYTRDFLFSLSKLVASEKLPTGIEPSILCEPDFWSNGLSQSSRDSDSGRFHHDQHKCLLQNSECGFLGNGFLGVCRHIAGVSAPMFQDNSPHSLHRSKEPYRPPSLYKAVNHSVRNPWDLYNDETFGSSECLSQKEEEEERRRRDLFEVMGKEWKKANQEKQKKNSDDHYENFKFITLPEDSVNEKRSKWEISEECVASPASVDNSANSPSKRTPNSDLTANLTKSPGICSCKFAHQFPVIEEKPTCGISSSEGAESVTHGVSNENATKQTSTSFSSNRNEVPDKLLNSAADGTSEQSYGCKHPAAIQGDLTCMDLEQYVHSETNEISSSMLRDGCNTEDGEQNSANNHDASQHLLFILQKGTEQKHMAAYSKLNIGPHELHLGDNRTDNNVLKILCPRNAGNSDASFGIQQSSVGRSARNDVPVLCKFPFPAEDNNFFPSTINEYGLIEISCEDSMFSSYSEQSKSRENQSVSDDFVPKIRSDVEIEPGLKLNSVSCFDEKDSLPIEFCLPDEDSLITVDDFRCIPNEENNPILMLEGNPVKADRVSSSPPVDISRKLTDLSVATKDEKSTQLSSEGSTCFCNSYDVMAGLRTSHNSLGLHACKSHEQFHQAQSNQRKTSFHPFNSQPAHMSSQMKSTNPNFNPHRPSQHPFSTSILPGVFHHSHVHPHHQQQQILIPGRIPQHQLNGLPRGAMTHLPNDQSCYMQELCDTQDFPFNYQPPNHGFLGMPNSGLQVYGGTNEMAFKSLSDGTEFNAGTPFYLDWP